jgi:hypothetical protein
MCAKASMKALNFKIPMNVTDVGAEKVLEFKFYVVSTPQIGQVLEHCFIWQFKTVDV